MFYQEKLTYVALTLWARYLEAVVKLAAEIDEQDAALEPVKVAEPVKGLRTLEKGQAR